MGAYSTPAGQRRKTNDLSESNDAMRGHAAWLEIVIILISVTIYELFAIEIMNDVGH